MLWATRAYRVLRRWYDGVGAVFMLHRVAQGPPDGAFAPNRFLTVSPEFLEAVVVHVRGNGWEFVSLSEAARRLVAGGSGKKFAVLTFDDGYRDNLDLALPILRRLEVPFTVYVCTGFADRHASMWWYMLEGLLGSGASVGLWHDGRVRRFGGRTPGRRVAAFDGAVAFLREMSEDERRDAVLQIADAYGSQLNRTLANEAMSWDELRTLSTSELVELGAHTVHHTALAQVSEEVAEEEIVQSVEAIEQKIGHRPVHLAYPYGDRRAADQREFALAKRLGFLTGVTTRKGLLYQEHRYHLHALPRVSLNGWYQRLRYVDVHLSGATFALWNGFRRVAS